MKEPFSRIIESSANRLPDPGEYRRLNRAALRLMMSESYVVQRPLFSRTLTTAAAVLLIILSGYWGPLGSNDFEYEFPTGQFGTVGEQAVHKDTCGGFQLTDVSSTSLAEEIERVRAADLGEPTCLTCLAYGGVEQWIFKKTVILSEGPLEIIVDNPPGLPCDSLPRSMEFYRTHGPTLESMMAEDPPAAVTTMVLESVTFEVKTWFRDFPGYGEVRYSRGWPHRPG